MPGRTPLQPEEVHVAPLSPARFKGLLEPKAWGEFERGLEEARQMLSGRVVWTVNSTPAGGGVAEMLRPFVAYSRGAEIDLRWMVIAGTPEFFQITKRIHNFVHGSSGDGGELGEKEWATYESVTAENAVQLLAVVRPEDVVLLHDPQTAGLTRRLKKSGVTVIWRSHVGAERPNERILAAWQFLAPFLEAADVCVFSRRSYVPPWAQSVRTEVIQPSIDAFSPKNQDLNEGTVRAILAHVGLVVGEVPRGALPLFRRQDDSPGRVDHRCDVSSAGSPPGFDTPLVVQVSRWDRLKDPGGVMAGFVDHVLDGVDAHLILAGPSVHGVADDPEGAVVFGETERAWRALPHAKRSRVHLASLPMIDIDENAAIVNALQRQATVVVQKSTQEGFGLTVAEAMWKARPVVASAVGGIKDQIQDGVSGVLLDDPRDLATFGRKTAELLSDSALAPAIGARAREHVLRHFLVSRHSLQYISLFRSLIG